MDVEKIITIVAGVLGIIATLFTIVKSVMEFQESRKEKNAKSNIAPKKTRSNPVDSKLQPRPSLSSRFVSLRKNLKRLWFFYVAPIGIVIVLNFFSLVMHWFIGAKINYVVSSAVFFIDVAFVLFFLDRWIYFFAQFVLPIQNPKDRQETYRRVFTRGPVLFVRNGRVIMNEGEAEKRGPGIVVLDTASAAVLRTNIEITDTLGPGIKFVKANEYLAGSVDLRLQWQFVGPLSSERSFLNPGQISSPHKFNDMEFRRQQTNGRTRDGLEISPTISIKFRVKRPLKIYPSESGVASQYGFDAESVRKAITREIRHVSNSDLGWSEFPSHLVIDVWREYIRKFKLEDLFTTTGVGGLRTIEEMIGKRLKKTHVIALDDTGFPTGEWLESAEFAQLQMHGLEVTDVRIHDVLFDTVFEEQIIAQWKPESLNAARKEAQHLRELESLLETVSREEASKLFAKITSKQIGVNTVFAQNNFFRLLYQLILPIKEFLVSENASSYCEYNEEKLDVVLKWLLIKSLDEPSDNGQRIEGL